MCIWVEQGREQPAQRMGDMRSAEGDGPGCARRMVAWIGSSG